MSFRNNKPPIHAEFERPKDQADRVKLRERVCNSLVAVGIGTTALDGADCIRPWDSRILDVFGHEVMLGAGAALAVLPYVYLIIKDRQSGGGPGPGSGEGAIGPMLPFPVQTPEIPFEQFAA
ncbi:MAG: hypothetical protein WDN66_05335 [Candidatus Saccharibacteria bacterium]